MRSIILGEKISQGLRNQLRLTVDPGSMDQPFYFKHVFLWLFLHNSLGGTIRNRKNHFRWVDTEPSVQFRKANMDPYVQFRKANADPSMQFRWDYTEFLFCKMLGKNLHESVRPFSHLQTSLGKSSCQGAFGKNLCNALPYCHPSEMHKNLIVLVTSL